MKAKSLQFGKAMSAALFVLLLNVLGMTKGYAYDFVVNGIYYNITSSTAPRTVEVTYSNNAWYYGNHYSGEVTIPSSVSRNGITYSVTGIGAHAFINSADLTSITISNKVSSIGYNAFYGCSGLEQITVASSNTYYDSRENCNAVIISSTNELIIGCKNTNIPNSVTSIGDGAFYGCSTLTSIAIPNSVISIGEEAFYGCTSLTGTLVIPNSVISIGMGAFGGDGEGWGACAALTGLSLGSSVQTIGAFAFNGCTELTGELILPSSLESLGLYSFGHCTGFTSIECNALIPPIWEDDVFYQLNPSIPIYVPCESLESYQTSGWSYFTNYFGVGSDCGNYIITASTNPIEGGTITGAGIYEEGDTCVLIASAHMGFSFVNWTEDDEVISTVPSYTFQVTEDRNIVANFFLVLGPGMLPGMFSVSDSVQVRFSQGNLQYIGSASTPYWKFADQQWELANGNESSSWSANRDLFGWGTSGWNNGNTYYQPYNTSWFNEDNGHYLGNLYGPSGQYDLIDEYANSDWGIYNSISNGGNQPNRWRTLSIDEWDYVFNQRNTSSDIRYAKAVVSGKKGVILLPDYWNSSTYSLNNVNRQNADYGSNNITASQWNTLEASGAVFLPTTGYRIGTTVDDQLDYGYYWSSSCSSIEGAGAFLFSPYESVWGICSRPRYGGLAVRLVSNWNATTCSIEVGSDPDEGGSINGMGTFAYGDTCTLSVTPNEGYSFINWTLNGEIVSSSPQYSFVVTHYGYYVAHFSKNYPDGAINAPFSVDSVGKHVCFSMGNLQYYGYCKFAEHQWEYFGTTIGQNGSSLHINSVGNSPCDLFAWGTGDNPASIVHNEVYQYLSFTDWGINPIINGGNIPNIWFTLNGTEWNYLINTRSTNSGIRYAKAQVNSVNGVILLPDNWNASTYNLNNTNQENASFESNVISATQWEILQSNGAVFLPAAGKRYNPYENILNVYVSDVGAAGYYWSKSGYHGVSGHTAGCLSFNDSELNTYSFASYYGFSVRLVHLVHSVEVGINPTESGAVIGSGWYGHGATCRLHAIPNEGYYFVNWTKNGEVISLEADYSFVVTENAEYVANFSNQPPTQLLTPTGAINGRFTINSGGTQVYFSQGNLQYNASNNDWHFAENQYDVIGNDNTNISSTYSGDIDLFGWGTSGYNHGAVSYQPWSTSTTGSDYYAYGYDLYDLNHQSGQADWGYNAITNGGNTINTWRTLTLYEWQYIFNTRTTNTGIRYAKAIVNDVSGVILLPDDWIADYYNLNNTNTEGASFNSNLITASQWSILEEHGAVFLPAADQRVGTSVVYTSNYHYADGYYWSATCYRSYNSAYMVSFRDSNLNASDYYFRSHGHSVRLVCLAAYKINAASNPIEGGTVSGGGTYANGAECTLTATANEGFSFTNWTKNGTVVSTNNSYTFTVTGSSTLVANFVEQLPNTYYNINVSSNLSTGGMVTGGGIYEQGQTCTVTATANEGYTFTNWTENNTVVSTSASYIFTVTGDRNLVANFSINSYNIFASADPTNGGTISGMGTYQEGETCTLIATANTGYSFTNWTENGNIVSTNANCSFTVTGNRNFVANFTLNNYYIATLVNPTIGGAVTGAGNYDYGTTATLNATANNGYAFLNWTENGNVVSTSSNYSFTVTGTRNLVANFSLNTYTVSASANPTAGGTVSGMGTFNYGEIATLTATANEGYTFSNWTENGNIVSTEASCSFTVTGDRNLVANFDTYHHNYSNDYFTLESLVDSNTITLSIPSFINSEKLSSVSYSTDGTTWTTLAIDATNQSISVTLDAGEKVYLKGLGIQYGVLGNGSSISAIGDFITYGNIMSLLYGDDFVLQTCFPAGSTYTFSSLFYNSTKLVSAESLVLPATALVEYCYYDMFHGCTALNSAPELPATSLAEYCYRCMFSGCTSLSSVPDLPATTLENSCYSAMFTNCTLLSNAPELPATTLASACYSDMFNGCTSLSSVPVLPATTMANACYSNMFYGCTSLSIAPELPATTLAAYCYNYMFAYCTSLSMAPELPATTLAGFCYSYMFVGCTSLNNAPELPATTLASCCYLSMFSHCTSLSSAPVLPAISLAEGCYHWMFSSCTSLSSVPELPATTLASSCYSYMFYGCTSLNSAPELPATTLAGGCYYFMFYGCTSLSKAPSLPAVTLASSCYGYMFSGCSSLNEVTCLATDISATECTENWLENVAESGVFHKNPEMNDWPLNSASGIPVGWNVDVLSVDITATANPAEGGTVTGSGTYNFGQTCTLIANANEGYSFSGWTENGELVSTSAIYSFEVTGARNLVANFAIQGPITNYWTPIGGTQYNMTMSGIILIDGVEQTVTTLEVGAFCGDECRGSMMPEFFPPTQQYVVSLTVVSNQQSGENITFRLYDHLAQQELDLQCANNIIFESNAIIGTVGDWYQFAFNSEVSVTATVNPEGAGTVTGVGNFMPGTTATLTATANSGYVFRAWTLNGETVSTDNPYTFTVTRATNLVAQFDLQHVSTLPTGWSWWSTYIEMNGNNGLQQLEQSLGHNGLMIKTQSPYVQNYYPSLGYDYWFGPLTNVGLTNEAGYQISLSNACQAVVSGAVADAATHPVTIAPGWNWIGYPVMTQQSLSTALANFTPAANDLIKGQNSSATYYANYGWFPTSFTLTPGQGYMYLSNATENKTLTYAVGRGYEATEKAPERIWTNNEHAFAGNLTVMAVVDIDGEEQRNEALELGAFVGGECRGSAVLTYFEPTDRWYAMLTIAGEEGEEISFAVIDRRKGNTNARSTNRVVFVENAVVGNLDQPYEVSFAAADALKAYPNPIGRNEAFTLDIPSNETVAEVYVYNVLGEVVSHESGAQAGQRMHGIAVVGVYTVKVVCKSGNAYVGRLIVK